MAVRIRSLLVSGPIVVPLSTGRNVRLSPGQSSAHLHDVEVTGNAKVDKLRRQGAIEVESVDESEEGAEETAGDASGDISGDKGAAAESRRSRKRPETADNSAASASPAAPAATAPPADPSTPATAE